MDLTPAQRLPHPPMLSRTSKGIGANIAGTDSLSEFGSNLEWCVELTGRSSFCSIGWFPLVRSSIGRANYANIKGELLVITYQATIGYLG